MDKELQILYIEDNRYDAELTLIALKRAGIKFKMRVVESEKSFRRALDEQLPDLILSDHSLPGFSSMQAFEIVKSYPYIPFILLTGSVSEQYAVDCLLAGIDDYILKSNLIRLPSSIERVMSKTKIRREKEVIEQLHSELQKTHMEVETKRQEITDSINYAKRIQDAVLPHEKEFDEEFSSSFIIYKPRDIVSGDLYWLANATTTHSREPLKMFAAVDCTGHGIPGAFMSLLVSVLLNETLTNINLNSPSDVLSYLNFKLPEILNRGTDERITDGLDIALCALDMSQRTLYFSGANRPLWIVRKQKQGFELLVYKGTKASIGGHLQNSAFETTTIHLQENDRLFIFSDGVTDQFGGPDGKKLGRKKLEEMLIGSAYLKMTEQKEFITTFLRRWQGKYEQVDDMLMIGVEIC